MLRRRSRAVLAKLDGADRVPDPVHRPQLP